MKTRGKTTTTAQRSAKVTQHKLAICNGLRCKLHGGGTLMKKVKNIPNIDEHASTTGGSVILETVRCSGSCHMAPLVIVDDRFLHSVQPNRLEALLGAGILPH